MSVPCQGLLARYSHTNVVRLVLADELEARRIEGRILGAYQYQPSWKLTCRYHGLTSGRKKQTLEQPYMMSWSKISKTHECNWEEWSVLTEHTPLQRSLKAH